jgi:hypothetical protein
MGKVEDVLHHPFSGNEYVILSRYMKKRISDGGCEDRDPGVRGEGK